MIIFVTDVLVRYGWKLEDNIHYCGTSYNPDLAMFEELSKRAFKAGENLVG